MREKPWPLSAGTARRRTTHDTRAIMGLMPRTTGALSFAGTDLTSVRAHDRFRLGLAYVPEERRDRARLDRPRENLQLGLVAARTGIDEHAAIDEIAESFPRIKERLDQEAVTMSGGEQQMLAIARAMIARPKMIFLLDEPSEGIMPVLVEEMGVLFRRLRDQGDHAAAGGTERRMGASPRRPRHHHRPGRGRLREQLCRAVGRQGNPGTLLRRLSALPEFR